MSAATTGINTPTRPGIITRYPVAASTTIYGGTLAALNSSGFLVPSADTAGLRVIGRAEETVNNSGGSDGDTSCDVQEGVFLLNNSASAAVDADDRGKICFIEDDNTVAETSTHKVKAGRVIDVVEGGVWVDTRAGQPALIPAADTLTGAADLTALKAALIPILQGAGIVK